MAAFSSSVNCLIAFPRTIDPRSSLSVKSVTLTVCHLKHLVHHPFGACQLTFL